MFGNIYELLCNGLVNAKSYVDKEAPKGEHGQKQPTGYPSTPICPDIHGPPMGVEGQPTGQATPLGASVLRHTHTEPKLRNVFIVFAPCFN